MLTCFLILIFPLIYLLLQEQNFHHLHMSIYEKKWGDILWNSDGEGDKISFKNVLQLKLQWTHSLTIVLQLWMIVVHLEQWMRMLASEWSIILCEQSAKITAFPSFLLIGTMVIGKPVWYWWVKITLHMVLVSGDYITLLSLSECRALFKLSIYLHLISLCYR